MSAHWIFLLSIVVASCAAVLAILVPSARRVRILKLKTAALRSDVEPLSRALRTEVIQIANRIKSYQ